MLPWPSFEKGWTLYLVRGLLVSTLHTLSCHAQEPVMLVPSEQRFGFVRWKVYKDWCVSLSDCMSRRLISCELHTICMYSHRHAPNTSKRFRPHVHCQEKRCHGHVHFKNSTTGMCEFFMLKVQCAVGLQSVFGKQFRVFCIMARTRQSVLAAAKIQTLREQRFRWLDLVSNKVSPH